jgi:integrase
MNPCTVKGGSTHVTPERPIANLSEVQALVAAMPDRLRIVVQIATRCTLRCGELLGLQHRDIDMENQTVTIVLTRLTGAKGQQWIVKGPKSDAGRRTMTIPAAMIPALSAHLQNYVTEDPDSLVLTGVEGGSLYPHVLQKAWEGAKSRVGLPELHMHDLRHTGGTLVAPTGASQKGIKARLGTSSDRAALIYQHASVKRDRWVAAALDTLASKVPLDVLAKCSPNGESDDSASTQ